MSSTLDRRSAVRLRMVVVFRCANSFSVSQQHYQLIIRIGDSSSRTEPNYYGGVGLTVG